MHSRQLFLLLAVGAAAGVPALAEAEITTTPKTSSSSFTLTPSEPVQTQCWQEGVRIIDEKRLRGPNLGAVLRENALLLERADRSGEVIILPVGQSICMIRPAGG